MRPFVHVPKEEADKSFVQHGMSSLLILLGALRVLFLYVYHPNFPLERIKRFSIVLNGMQRIALCRALFSFFMILKVAVIRSKYLHAVT